jgi:hypothetical protein
MFLQYCLKLPRATPVASLGLGMRRVEREATAGHDASINMALRMGYKPEGARCWYKVVYNKAKKGAASREGDPFSTRLRFDSATFSFCADSWEDGGREIV